MIDKEKLLAALAAKVKHNINTCNHIWVEGYQAAIDVVEEMEEESKWHECFDDDPSSFPDDDRIVLMSFANNPCAPAAGWYERDEDGVGRFTDGGQMPLSEYGLVVDGWWEMPIKPEDEEAFAFRRLCNQIYKEIKEGK